MSKQNDLLTCVEKLEECVKAIKEINHKLDEISAGSMHEATALIEEGIEILEHKLEEEINFAKDK